MKRQKHILISLLISGIFSCVLAQDPFESDSTLSSILSQSIANSIEIADVNNDGYDDILLSGYDSTRFGIFIDVFLGNSNGTLSRGFQTNYVTYPDTIAEYLGGIGNISVADVNLDGGIDIYVNGSARSSLLLNNSSGSFSESSFLPNLSVTYSNGGWGDVNMDGRPDLFLMGVNEYADNILNELYVNSGNNLDEDLTTIFPSLFTGSSTWGDFDNDGDPDIAIGNSPGKNFIFLNLNNGENWQQIILSKKLNRTYDIISFDLNDDGNIDIIEANSDETNYHHIIKIEK